MTSLNQSGLWLALALSAVAGFVDAIGFITLGGYFVSFMSGNSTRLAAAAAGLAWRDALFGLGLVALFVGGVAIGHLIGRNARARTRRLLLVEAVLLLAAAWGFSAGFAQAAIPMMVLAMGIANAVRGRDGAPAIGVTHMTGALTRIGEGIAGVARGGRASVWPWLGLWLALIAGAVTGAALGLSRGGMVLALPALALALIGIVTGPDREWHGAKDGAF